MRSDFEGASGAAQLLHAQSWSQERSDLVPRSDRERFDGVTHFRPKDRDRPEHRGLLSSRCRQL